MRRDVAGGDARLTLLQKSRDVLLGNASTQTGAGHLRQIDVVLARDFADERGRAGVIFFFGLNHWLALAGWGSGWRYSLLVRYRGRGFGGADSGCCLRRRGGRGLAAPPSPSAEIVPTTVFT